MYKNIENASITDKLMVMDVAIFMKPNVIIENVLTNLFEDSLYKMKLNITFDNVLHLTDGPETNTKVQVDGTGYNIHTENVNLFDKKIIDNSNSVLYRNTKSVVIIGYLNRIDPDVLSRILSVFHYSIIVIYGDESLVFDSEYNNIHSSFVSNTKSSIFENFNNECYDIPKKKIFNILSKMRKYEDHHKLAKSSIFTCIDNPYIDAVDVIDYVDNTDDSLVVVPNSNYEKLVSRVWNLQYGYKELEPHLGMRMYNIHPVILKDEDGVYDVIPGFSEMDVVTYIETDPYVENSSVILNTVDVSIKGKLYREVRFDYGFWLSNFDREEHFEYEGIFNLMDKTMRETYENVTSTIQCIPFRISLSKYAKYGKFSTVRVYKNLYNEISYIDRVSEGVYNAVCTAVNKVDIVESKRFEVK